MHLMQKLLLHKDRESHIHKEKERNPHIHSEREKESHTLEAELDLWGFKFKIKKTKSSLS